ncbi:shikimate kinase [Zunongwangia atlantica]|uniref:Shikimate kinase n=1 Tax=Zunongwangia atlantica 22II14-10F7 TaxID=1185767 RepID=A0A1Y1T5G4_9FLAO|nr:shikimate kinase [Zunongwangia atlantica]ORL46268.1 shikimate kinase [Zunongwangia atlantica 22II14-10F7]
MKIFLNGYMGSGKSHIGKILSESMGYPFVDMDDQIEIMEGRSIHEIFQKKGELYFRKLENEVLKDILASKSEMIVSLGGGTPCYGNNFDLIKEDPENRTVYLKASVEQLTSRLFLEKVHRPVISHLDTKDQLEEFIRKHLFERAFYYNQSSIIVDVDGATPTAIVENIKSKLD